jgi:hypothetical protein
MGATSDGKKNFDRWVSSVEGENITLDILETQVATHHHEITSSTSNAITSVNANGYVTVPTVGNSINVLTIKDEQSLVNGELDVITSVEYSTNPDSDGGHTLEISEGTLEDGVGHNHNISSHSHTANFVPQDIIKEYETLSQAIKETGINSKSIRDAAKGVQKHAGGYCWKYKDEGELAEITVEIE